MSNLLDKLIKLDKEAQELDKSIKDEIDNLEVEIQKEIESVKIKHMNNAEEKIKTESDTLRKNAEINWNENKKKYDVTHKNLKDNFDKNYDRWVDMIVDDVLN